MRKSIIPLMALSLLWITDACRDHEEAGIVTGKVSLSVNHVATDAGRIGTLDNLDKIVLTIENESGSRVVDAKEISVSVNNNEYVAQDIELPVGNYKLTYFVAIDADKRIIAVTPIEGSRLASLVSDPLPINFQITKGQTNDVAIEIVGITGVSPIDFGYVSFGLDSKKVTAFWLSVLGSSDDIHHIEYEFKHESEIISGTGDFKNGLMNLNKPEMMGKTYDVKLKLWFNENDGFVPVYWYFGKMTFNGDAIQLPSLNFPDWRGYYYKDAGHFKVYFGLDGRSSDYRVLIEQEPLTISNGFVDRTFYDKTGFGLGDDECGTIIRPLSYEDSSLLELVFSNPCVTTELDYSLDSFVNAYLSSNGEMVQVVFRWQVINGSIIPIHEPVQ